MLPKSIETPSGLYLKSIAEKACSTSDGLDDWPGPTKDDFVLVGGYVVLFSYADMNLRRIIEVSERLGSLDQRWSGKTAKFTAAEVAAVVQTLPFWSDNERRALARLERARHFRNLIAHFAIRRFPNDDAFLFIAKSARDYKRVFGEDPAPGVLLTAYAECEPMRSALKDVEHIQNWIAQEAPKLEKELIPS